ncbi:Predicted ester cyclase [Bacillus sp. 491mf]|uniref:ester cyclase n=1 Tax=Bacillus sp. 491mf TaxID=1761755 RepID=UPI0008E5F40D|nr:Predicted ester cyclase [Bacillus sp. 491mf]
MSVKNIASAVSIFGFMIMLAACHTQTSEYKTAAPAKKDIQLLKDFPQPKSMTIDPSLNQQKAMEMVHAAQRFYAFWNTGNDALIPQAVTDNFFDNTLPKERPQGPKGLTFASSNFRKAVPDLQCNIEDLLVTGDKVTARLSFTGTHKGNFGEKQPTGKAVHFFAIDILRVKDGKIVEDWHLEDNLTLMQQLGVVPEN